MANGLFNPNDLYEALKKVGLLPEVSRQEPYNASGEYNFYTNRIMAPDVTSTQAHEMTHAVQYNLLKDAASRIADKDAAGEKLTPQELQFWSGMRKLYGESFGTVSQFNPKEVTASQKAEAKKLMDMYYKDKTKLTEYDRYRTSRKEQEAFGVGNSSVSNVYNQVPHLDTTNAQEFSILLSLYNSLPDTIKKDFAEKRATSIQNARNAGSKGGFQEPYWDKAIFESLTTSPFAPTIK